ncbi:MAG: hypothetical protein A2284_07195 [Deltaproteobacteria bacterium RIFOXYA12_FULL_61_11]|nr:MAG: hypothetical protein A2284_07195 [Deltaproteobacteria bacterium RIFOXYA12_FULL_61_11]
MEPSLKFTYDREVDILHIDLCPPYAEQESREVGDDVIARYNPTTDALENLEVLFFSSRLLRKDLFEIPLKGHFPRNDPGILTEGCVPANPGD